MNRERAGGRAESRPREPIRGRENERSRTEPQPCSLTETAQRDHRTDSQPAAEPQDRQEAPAPPKGSASAKEARQIAQRPTGRQRATRSTGKPAQQIAERPAGSGITAGQKIDSRSERQAEARQIRLGRPFGPGFALRPGLIAPHVETPAPARGRHRQRAGQDRARPGRKRPAAPAGQRSRPQDKPPPFSSGRKARQRQRSARRSPPDRALPALRVDSRAGPRPHPCEPYPQAGRKPCREPRALRQHPQHQDAASWACEKKRRGRRQGSRAGPIRRTCDAGKEGRAKEPPG